ncbi:MAG: metal ABC transporter permease [Pedosphaera sp.]|nr:metal ABC transporter permease [Pedosphaera sp.]
MSFIPHFSAHQIFIAPWTTDFSLYGWMVLMTFLVGAACGLVGNYLILRRMALMGDAISHSVLPGIVVAFLVTGSRGTVPMFAGAVAAAVLTTVLIEVIHRHSRVKQDAAIGIAFSSLFALGVILIAVFADTVDLDQDCVLNGELPLIPLSPPMTLAGMTLGPPAVVRMGCVLFFSCGLIVLFYKELLLSSFDPALASAMGLRSGWIHQSLMIWLSITVVSAFEAVGAILVIAMLILPGATAALISDRLVVRLGWSLVHAALSAVLGLHLSIGLDCSPSGAAVVVGSFLFGVAWIFGPQDGLVSRWWSRKERGPETLV